MYISDACKAASTTKKAIEYYCEKGLIKPAATENGYRLFSEEDVARLKKISALRSMGVSVGDIKELLEQNDVAAYRRIAEKKGQELSKQNEQYELFRELAASQDWTAICQKAAMLEARRSVMDRLMEAFPGFYGQLLSLHFSRFLHGTIQTEDQEAAYNEICEYLDGVSLDIPDELKGYLDEIEFDAPQNADLAVSDAIENPESYINEHREMIERYMEFKKSSEYMDSPGYKLMQALKSFNQERGYNSVFIPAMRRLSREYDEYQKKLHEADKAFGESFTKL